MTQTQKFIEQEERYGAHNYHPLDVVLTKGQGAWVWDVEGRKYLDCLAAYSAVNQGHNHPRLVKALKDQLDKLALTSRAFRNDQLGAFCEELSKVCGLPRVLPMNSGAEAVETAIKAVRKWGYTLKKVKDGKADVIVADDNFHGRTITIVGFSSEAQYRSGFGPFAPGFTSVLFGDANAVERAITPNTVAVLIEPVQGEAGIIIPPAGYLKQLREICTRHRVLLILDEIQSGLGRTGKMFAHHHHGIAPDGLIVGKALSGGLYPVSAFVATDEIMDVFKPGDHGSTYGGNPLAAAVAREALRVLVDEGLVENSAAMGQRLRDGIMSLPRTKLDKIKQLRQIGLWIGLELKHELGGARPYCVSLMQRGMLCKDTHKHTIRLAPPLVVTASEVDWAVEQLAAVL
ncbi:MAG: ornithine--oxo-acid transaminase [Acidobacteriota bacterium]